MSSPDLSMGHAPQPSGRVLGSGAFLSHPGGHDLTLHTLELSGLKSGSLILDLGCGAGASTELMSALGFDPIGVDPRCKPGSRNGAAFIRAQAESLPLPGNLVHGILAECSLSVMQDLDRVLAQCARVLLPGGRLMISDLYARAPRAVDKRRAMEATCTTNLFSAEALRNKLCSFGFTVNHFEDCSNALASFTAQYLWNHDSIDELWHCQRDAAAGCALDPTMKSVRAGYFLLVATLEEETEYDDGN
ncbi:MAG: class I SAM-dependent methyltransferase [Terracidiphilus sp.]|nr:class I SAM-dependent methyltransferase [Terracidiphilus sp.]